MTPVEPGPPPDLMVFQIRLRDLRLPVWLLGLLAAIVGGDRYWLDGAVFQTTWWHGSLWAISLAGFVIGCYAHGTARP